MTVDYIIVGQGLAGSALALALRSRGCSVLVVDRGDESSASRVAAGLMTTLAGKSMNPGVIQSQALFHAIDWYEALEKKWGISMFHPLPILRLYDDAKQRDKLKVKRSIVSEWLEECDVAVDGRHWNAQYGAFLMRHTGWLDTKKYLEFVRNELEVAGAFLADEFLEGDVEFKTSSVYWKGVTAKKVVLCQGAFGLGKGWFADVPHRSAKGDILTISSPSLDQSQIVNRNGWMIPLGEGRWKCGATYIWDNLGTNLLDSGRAEVCSKIEGLTSVEYEVLQHEAGVRPIVRRSQPVIGIHPDYDSLVFFNGLGSKGVMYAPLAAENLADTLTGEVDIDPMWDLAKL